MRLQTNSLVALAAWAGLLSFCRGVNAQSTPAAKPDAALTAVAQTFEKAFNAHNAPALSALWAPDAVYRTAATGAEVKGRDAIAAAYADLFKQEPKSTLKITVQSSSADGKTATLAGMAEVSRPGEAPTRSLFKASLARVGASWLLTSVEEAELPPDSPSGMSQLGWLAGTWSEELPSGKVTNRFHWVDGGAFMVRNYWREAKDGPAVQGTQIFGWDPEQSCVRTWLFDSSGSFGEGYWQRQAKAKWVNKMAIKLPDGRRGSVSQILSQTDKNTLTLQSVDREIDGQAMPNSPVATLTRMDDAPAHSQKGTQP